MRYTSMILTLMALTIGSSATAPGAANKEAEGLKTQALGMFIHWSADYPLGSVISHHLVGSTGENRCLSNERCKATWRQKAEQRLFKTEKAK